MLSNRTALVLAASLAIAACTRPADVSGPVTASDKNAKVAIKPTASGFTVDVRYSRYQFVPESNALITACRSIVIARANEEAARAKREIDPVAEQAIRVSTGRNILSGRTSCRAFTEARWAR